MKETRSQKRRTTSRRESLNAIVYGLLVLAVLLGGVASWQRFAVRINADPGDVAERRIDPLLARLGVPDSWVPVGGLPPGAAAASQSRFICSRCQAACFTGVSLGSPPCPFCGVAMSRQGLGRQEVGLSPLGGTAGAGGKVLFAISPNAICPHADRGACSNCHTISTTATPGITPIAAAQNAPGAAWQGIAAPAISAGADAPTLIEEMGMEIYQTQGGGVRVTGIMGNSFAAKAGMSVGDIIIRFNGTSVRNVGQFDRLVLKAPPEAEAQLVIMRNGRTRDLAVMVDEGEMDGFLPIQRP